MGYHTNEELAAATRAVAAAAGARATLRQIGASRGGEQLLAVTVAAPGRAPEGARPQALITANMHGNEVIGSELALHLLELSASAEPPGGMRALLEVADLTVLPASNLDSRRGAALALREGDMLARSSRGNGAGVDLNRNFPPIAGAVDVWHPLAGSSQRWSPWYRGAAPLSEPEARAVAELAAELRPAASLSLHSVGALVLYPWCYAAQPPADLEAFEAMGRAYTDAQPQAPYQVKQAHAWYTILGDMDDWMYDAYGTLVVTVELGRTGIGLGGNPLRALSALWWMNPRDPAPTVAHTADACVAALAEGVRRKTTGAPAP